MVFSFSSEAELYLGVVVDIDQFLSAFKLHFPQYVKDMMSFVNDNGDDWRAYIDFFETDIHDMFASIHPDLEVASYHSNADSKLIFGFQVLWLTTEATVQCDVSEIEKKKQLLHAALQKFDIGAHTIELIMQTDEY